MRETTRKVAVSMVLIFLFAVSAFIFYTEKRATDADSSPLCISPRDVNLKNILQGHEASSDVLITNRANHSLRITNIRYSCGCTSYTIDRQLLKPKESSNLKIKVNAEKMEGLFHVKIVLSWKDLCTNLTGNLNIEVKGNATSIFKISDDIINFHDVDADSKNETKQLIIEKGTSSVKWSDLRIVGAANHNISIKCLDANTFILSYKIRPFQLPIGMYKDEIRLKAYNNNRAIDSEVDIPVSAQINSHLKLIPSCIYLGVMTKDVPKTGHLNIWTTNGSAIKLISFSSPSYLQVKLTEKGSDYLKFTYKSSSRIFPLRDAAKDITINISTDKERLIKIPVIAFMN